MTSPALALEGVHAGYGRMEILKGIDLVVGPGEIVTLIGANGAGKSTTVNTLSGLVRARRGTIRFFGEEITNVEPARRVAMGLVQVPEGRKLFSELTVAENLEMGAFLRRDRAGVKKDMDAAFGLFPILKERERQLAGSLSGGEQQMCAIARGLMARPKVLLLDEPSLGLAPLLVQQIFGIIETLHRDGATILLVEQNANAALRLANRGYVMETGVITHTDDSKKLLTDEKVREAYLGK